jgi:hypothetical protein
MLYPLIYNLWLICIMAVTRFVPNAYIPGVVLIECSFKVGVRFFRGKANTQFLTI